MYSYLQKSILQVSTFLKFLVGLGLRHYELSVLVKLMFRQSCSDILW